MTPATANQHRKLQEEVKYLSDMLQMMKSDRSILDEGSKVFKDLDSGADTLRELANMIDGLGATIAEVLRSRAGEL